MYFDLCVEICRIARERNIPVVIGGAYLNQPMMAQPWLEIPGLTAIVGGEAEPFVSSLTKAVARGDDISDFPCVWTPEGGALRAMPPLKDLDALRFPDYRDFPWQLYPQKIIPMITDRSCVWGACSFCSDVTSSMGRTFRSRSPANVLDELDYQAREIGASQFIFVDLKLNSELSVWHGLIDGISKRLRASCMTPRKQTSAFVPR